MTGRTIRLISLCATFWIARSLRHIRRRTSVAESIGFLPRSDSLHQGIDLFVSEHSPCTLRERGHCSSAHTVGNDAANCGVVRNCEKNGIRQSDGCPAFAVRTVASSAVLSVEKFEFHNLVWRENLRVRSRPTRRTTAAGAGRGSDHRGNDDNGLKLHGCGSSPLLFSSIAPGVSMPARTAKGRYCQVRTRSCLDTTMPATTPNPICDMTNHSQSIRWLSTRSEERRVLWSRPDHKMGAITPPSRIGRRGNMARATP